MAAKSTRSKAGSESKARATVAKTYKLYVGGAFIRSESGRVMAVKSGDTFVANCARASRKDFRDAVKVARGALSSWSGKTAFNRSQILYRAAEMLEDRRAVFVDRLQSHAGFNEAAAEREVSVSVDRLFWYAGWADKFTQVLGGVNPVAMPFFNFTLPEPTGVVAVLASSTSPLAGLISAIAPVLAGGNTCVVLTDHDAPTIPCDFGEVLATSDFPGGVVNLLTGSRSELLPHVASHMDVNAVALFGGSKEERVLLETEAAENVKRVRCFDDPPVADWASSDHQSPYWIESFVEWKTAWHPVGL